MSSLFTSSAGPSLSSSSAPQEDYFGIKDGQDATVTVPQLPEREFHGKVTRNAQALQSGTRTLLTEVDLDNRDGALAAGLFCVVYLDVLAGAPVALVPSEAVIFDKSGLSAAVSRTACCGFDTLTSWWTMARSSRLRPGSKRAIA